MTGMEPGKELLTGDYRHDRTVLEQHLQSLSAAVSGLQASGAASVSAVELRLKALQAARQHIAGLDSEKPNDRGYRDHALKPGERLSEELRIARYLLEGTDAG